MKILITIKLLLSLAVANSVMAQTDGQQMKSTDTLLVLIAERQLGDSSKINSWVEPASSTQESSAHFVINDVPLALKRENSFLQTEELHASESVKMVGWMEMQDSKIETTRIRSMDSLTVVNDNAVNGEVQLPRTYGFTRGAMLPLFGAAGDSISTHIALKQANVYEVNKIINTSPAGLLGLFAIKAGAIYLIDQQKPEIRKPLLKITAGLWNGVVANNLLIATGATNPAGILAGIAYGIYMYQKQSDILEQEEALARQ